MLQLLQEPRQPERVQQLQVDRIMKSGLLQVHRRRILKQLELLVLVLRMRMDLLLLVRVQALRQERQRRMQRQGQVLLLELQTRNCEG